jgi:hypothetical protein
MPEGLFIFPYSAKPTPGIHKGMRIDCQTDAQIDYFLDLDNLAKLERCGLTLRSIDEENYKVYIDAIDQEDLPDIIRSISAIGTRSSEAFEEGAVNTTTSVDVF